MSTLKLVSIEWVGNDSPTVSEYDVVVVLPDGAQHTYRFWVERAPVGHDVIEVVQWPLSFTERLRSLRHMTSQATPLFDLVGRFHGLRVRGVDLGPPMLPDTRAAKDAGQ